MSLKSLKAVVTKVAKKVNEKLDTVESLKEAAQDLLIKPYTIVLYDGKTVDVHTMTELVNCINFNSKDVTILKKKED